MSKKKDLFNKEFFKEYRKDATKEEKQELNSILREDIGGDDVKVKPPEWSELRLDLDPDKIKEASAMIKDAMKTLSSDSGIMNTDVPEPSINFIEAPNSLSIKTPNNRSGIVFGTDRPSTLESGIGGKGGSGANTIDIVAGRGSSCKNAEKKAGVNPNMACDGARIYISEKTEVDLHFGLAAGIIGSGQKDGVKRAPGSAVAIKADDARVIGRNGVKIVTGRSFAFRAGPGGEKRSSGGELSEVPAPAIELIAGNNTEERKVFGGLKNPIETVNNLQGIARGDYTRDAIKEIAAMFEQVISCIDRLLWLQEAFNVMMGPSVWEPWRPPGSALTVGAQMTMINSSIWNLRIDKILWEINYLYPFGYKYVASQNVYST